MKNSFLSIFLLFVVLLSYSQEKNKPILKPYKVGFLYSFGTNENFFFDDLDYTYTTSTYKAQAFFNIGNWKNIDLELIIQPQIQFIKHQLINEQFITPDQENYLEKRTEFTQVKNMNLYGLEFGFGAKKKLTEKLNLLGAISLGFSYIDARTERLAKGFTFIENFSLGFSYKTLKRYELYLGTSFGHVSNLNFQKPNDGYNILGLDIGFSYLLK
ncbi:acyloxyacyl hydrolase [Polaribacter sp. SA4-10]|uniref:acyloxyacyl hydrolase n=1 Tax=Polaribacter sp. SA4-10 TaxID=754397 RepID=UPI001E53FB56|nr:acyloxyacyl hydrolase [Polaribacter sp. SA4-10]